MMGANERGEKLAAFHEKKSGVSAEVLARCPGRVNMMGDHVDYSGFSVFPFALDGDLDVYVALSFVGRTGDGVRVRSFNVDDRFAAQEWSLEGRGEGWGVYLHTALCYVHARYGKGAGEYCVCVDGRVPAGSGLSSSSAFVCAVALAALERAGALEGLTREAVAELCADAERTVGMESGGMDQAIAMLGRRDMLMRVDFAPLKAVPCPLPAEAVVVVLDSLVRAEKLAVAATGYNLRVVECRLAAAAVSVQMGLPLAVTLRDLYERGGFERLVDLEQALESFLPASSYLLPEVAELCRMSEHDVRSQLFGALKDTQDLPEFELLSRARHVVAEAVRVFHFENLCGREPYEDQLTDIGELLDESHASLRDLYDCSTPELDALADAARRAGAVGARITGAGWGGCVIAVVPRNNVHAFSRAVKADYYDAYIPALDADRRKTLRPPSDRTIFVTRPGDAASILILTKKSKL